MEAVDLKQELTLLLEKEIGFSGKFILQKQCRDLNIELDRLSPSNLEPLAKRVSLAIKGYTGEKRAEQIRKGILEYRRALDTVDSTPEEETPVEEMLEARLTIAEKKLEVDLVDEAEESLREAEELLSRSEIEDRDEIETRLHRYLGRTLTRNRGRADDAVKEYELSISSGRKAGLSYDVALSLNGIGAIAWRRGDHKRALKLYNEALEVLRPMPTPSRGEKLRKRAAEAIIKSGLGNVYLDLVDMDSAIRFNEEAIELSKKLEKWSEVGRIYNNLARVYEEMGNYPKAIDRYQRGIRYSKDAGMLRLEGWTLTNLASALVESGRVSDALPHLERAEKILGEFRDPIAHSKLHCMWGKYHREKGAWDAAVEHFQKSVDFIKDENAPDYLAIAEEEFGTLYQRMGKDKEARKLLKSALKWYEQKEERNRILKIQLQLDELGK